MEQKVIMIIETFVGNDFPENCYAVILNDGIFIVDPGEETKQLLDFVRKNKQNIKYILLTHLHFDHIRAVSEIKNMCPLAKIVIHALDGEMLNDDNYNLSSLFGYSIKKIKPDILCNDGDIINIGDYKIKVIHTPGHTRGSVCYAVNDVIFSGDTLFELSCGRTDFPGGDYLTLANSLEKLKNLDGDFKVYSGHGNPTTLNAERMYNPYIRNL